MSTYHPISVSLSVITTVIAVWSLESPSPTHPASSLQIWVHSAHNASGYFTIYGDESLQSDHFSSRLSFGDTQTVWARTGYLGFLRRTELTDANGGEHAQRCEGPGL